MVENMNYYELTYPQKSIWNIEKMYQDTTIGNISATMKISAKIDFQLMERAINLVIQKNDAFRIRIVEIDGNPLQYVTEYIYKKLDFIDFSTQGIEKLYEWDMKQAQTPLKLLDSELCYFAVLKISKEMSGFFIKVHHTIADAWSLILFGNEVMYFYKKLSQGINIDDKNYCSYINYISSEKAYLNSERFLRDKNYWNGKFSDLPELTALKVRKDARISTDAKRKTFIMPAKLRLQIEKYCSQNRISILTLFSSALSLYLGRVLNKEDIIFGTPVLNRLNRNDKETIGMFVSMVPVRLKIDMNSGFDKYVQYVQKELLSVLMHQRYSTDMILKDIRETNKGFGKLYDISLSYQNSKIIKDDDSVRREGRWHFNGHQVESLNIHINERENDGTLILDYDFQTALFCPKEIEFIHDHMMRLLWHAIDNPSKEMKRLDMVSEKEKNRILYEFNNTGAYYPKEKLVHQVFEEQAFRRPDDVAILFENKSMTYCEVNEKANQLARLLKSHGVAADCIVGIMVPRSFEMLIGILAILKAGGAYLPLDPGNPADRIRYMLENSKAGLLLTSGKLKDSVGFNGRIIDIFQESIYSGDRSNPEYCINSNNLAYVIYTSGSTGRPKGVMIEHYSVINRINWMQKQYPISAEDTILQKTTYTFDVSVWELFWWFFAGTRVAMLQPMGEKDPAKIVEAIYNHRVTTIHFVPSMLNIFLDYCSMLDNLDMLSPLKQVFASGEALSPQVVAKFNNMLFRANGTRLHNLYGPTEATVDVSYFDCSPEIVHGTIPIGRPIDNTQLYILDPYTNILPIGIMGELYISGDGLARGYVNNPELTAEKFVDNPFIPGKKMYRTGDLARWFPKGDIEYLGRIDHQVKIRGFRIELGEIEKHILEYGGITEATVSTREKNGNVLLCAYIVSGESTNTAELKKVLSKKLPGYMVPSHYIVMDRLPLSANGKIDRKNLPEPVCDQQIEYVAPRNEIETEISKIWSKVLNADIIGIDDDFFQLGGDSLQVMQVVALLSRQNLTLTIQDFYESPTIRELACKVSRNDNAGNDKKRKTEPVTGIKASINLINKSRIQEEPIKEQILKGRLPALDSAALCYFPGIELSDEYFNHKKAAERKVELINHTATELGNIGIIGMPLSINSLYNDKSSTLYYAREAAGLAKSLGAKVISLTGLIPSATRYGLDIAESCSMNNIDIKVTTGHQTTAASVILSVEKLLTETNRFLSNEKVCVIGLGSIGTTVTKLLLRTLDRPAGLVLCDIESKHGYLKKLKDELEAGYKFGRDIDIALARSNKLPDSVYECTMIIGATNAPDIIDIEKLRPGTLIIDDSGPHCFSKEKIINRLYERQDVIFTEGGVLQSLSRMKKVLYLPEYINPDIINSFKQLFLNAREITGCVLSGLLSAKFPELKPLVAKPETEDCHKHYEVLKRLGYNAARLHCEEFIIPELFVERFRSNFNGEYINA